MLATAALLVLFLAAAGHAQSAAPCPEAGSAAPDTSLVRRTVHYLASPELDGRATWTQGYACAQAYTAGLFASLGLAPAGDSSTYLQWIARDPDLPHPAANVVGMLRGTDAALAGEAIVVGAHLDHLGRAPDGRLHPGADDNASGVAALARAAQLLRAEQPLPRTIVFVAFAGEETMLAGSRHFLAEPPVPPHGIRAMLNLDMVGRLHGGVLGIHGAETSPSWGAIVAGAAVPGLPVELRPLVAGSDHGPFHRAGIPVLYLHTGLHPDHHKPTDTADRVDLAGVERIARATALLAAGAARAGVARASASSNRSESP